jgi:Na+/melibiose symporter-like transporter
VLELLAFPLNYQVVFNLLSAGRLISLYFSSHLELPDTPPALVEAPPARGLQLRALIDLVRQQPAFASFTAKRFVFLSGIALAAPLFPLYFVREAQASEAAIGLISTAQTFTLVIGYRLWTGLSRTRGSRLVLLWTTLGLSFYPALVAATHRVEVIVGLAALAGIFQAGLDLVFFDELMKTVPASQTALYVSVAQSLQHLSAIAAPLVGTLLADHIGLGGALVVSAALRLVAYLMFVRGRPAPDTRPAA